MAKYFHDYVRFVPKDMGKTTQGLNLGKATLDDVYNYIKKFQAPQTEDSFYISKTYWKDGEPWTVEITLDATSDRKKTSFIFDDRNKNDVLVYSQESNEFRLIQDAPEAQAENAALVTVKNPFTENLLLMERHFYNVHSLFENFKLYNDFRAELFMAGYRAVSLCSELHDGRDAISEELVVTDDEGDDMYFIRSSSTWVELKPIRRDVLMSYSLCHYDAFDDLSAELKQISKYYGIAGEDVSGIFAARTLTGISIYGEEDNF